MFTTNGETAPVIRDTAPFVSTNNGAYHEASKRSWKITTIRDRSRNNTGRSVTPRRGIILNGEGVEFSKKKKWRVSQLSI